MATQPRPLAFRESSKVKLETFRSDIQAAVDHAFDPHPTAYRKVIVQFFRFYNDDIYGVADLENELGNIFVNTYAYDVRYSVIGANQELKNPSMEVSSILTALGVECTGKGSLVIIVYSAHGKVLWNKRQPTLEVG